MLSVRGFLKSYHEEKILSVDSLTLQAGIHLFKGVNGSGKTTFFKCLAGISPCSGDIRIAGVSLQKDAIAYRHLVNFAEAEPVYPGYLTARDIMLFVGKTKKATSEQMKYYKEALGIDAFYEKPASTFSSGMLKKLSLAVAFLGEPRMIILDEPLITLDDITRQSFLRIMDEKKGTLFLLSSHQAFEDNVRSITTAFKIENKTLIAEASH